MNLEAEAFLLLESLKTVIGGHLPSGLAEARTTRMRTARVKTLSRHRASSCSLHFLAWLVEVEVALSPDALGDRGVKFEGGEPS